MQPDKPPITLYFPRFIPTGKIFTRTWIEQFFPFFANPFFIIRLALFAPFINASMRPISGLIGADKTEVLKTLPESARGTFILYETGSSVPDLSVIKFPAYLKPSIGERSVDVRKIETPHIFHTLVATGTLAHRKYWIIQEAFEGIEFGITVVRPLGGAVTIPFLAEKRLTTPSDTASIANGATFHDVLCEFEKHSISIAPLVTKIETLFAGDGYFSDFQAGRFDVKANDISSLASGDFKVIELNGIGGMPLVYFDKECYPLWNRYFLTLLSLGRTQKKRYSIFRRAWMIVRDIPSAFAFLLHQKHFRDYLKKR